jgi:hypothetical protein
MIGDNSGQFLRAYDNNVKLPLQGGGAFAHGLKFLLAGCRAT